jgi:hypothetical protein
MCKGGGVHDTIAGTFEPPKPISLHTIKIKNQKRRLQKTKRVFGFSPENLANQKQPQGYTNQQPRDVQRLRWINVGEKSQCHVQHNLPKNSVTDDRDDDDNDDNDDDDDDSGSGGGDGVLPVGNQTVKHKAVAQRRNAPLLTRGIGDRKERAPPMAR